MKILLAEDERTISRLIRQVLTNNGHEVTWCASGREAVELLERERFDLVLLDLHLADGDGMRVVAAIEAASEPGPPVVLMTGEGGAGRGRPAYAAGGDHPSEAVRPERT